MDIEESISPAERLARARRMKKRKMMLALARKKQAKKIASNAKIYKRADKAARRAVFKKLAKGKTKSEMSASQKSSLEKRLNKMQPRIRKIAIRMRGDVRRLDQGRI